MKTRMFWTFVLITQALMISAQYASHKSIPDKTKKVITDLDDWAYKISTTITAADLKDHIYTLASDDYEGRETGTPGNAKAANYIAKEFERLGLPKVSKQNNFFQPVDFTFSKWESLSLRLGATDLKLLRDFISFPQYSSQSEIAADKILFLGYGINDENYSDYRGIDVSDQIIMIWDGEPTNNMGTSLITGTSESSSWGTDWKTKAKTAHEKGAKLVIIISNDLKSLVSQNRRALVNRVTELGNTLDNYELANTIFISPSEVETILGEYAEDIIAKRDQLKNGEDVSLNKELQIEVEASMNLNREVLSGHNVLGYIEGSEIKDEVVIVSAHYDHVGTKGDEVYNGADDNASGTTTVLEIAEAFVTAQKLGHGPKRSVLCLLVTGEEKGLLGSEYYAAHPTYPLESTVADVNIDMVGRWGKEYLDEETPYIYVIGSDRLSQDLHDINEEANNKYSQLLLDYKYNADDDPNRFYFRSDHYNFAKHGIPSIFFFNGVHVDYHRLTDTVDKIDLKLMERRARLIFHTIWTLANRDERIRVTVEN